ncbi:MAG: translation elongation factor Ts [Myxococcota bacterium]
MPDISAATVKELRERTGAGMLDCKKALEECAGDTEKAIDYLRKKGLAAAAKKAGRTAKEGLVYSYIHMNRVGVLIEVNCETDFVARTPDFQQVVKEIALQIAATSPQVLARDDVPAAEVAREREVREAQAKASGKPDGVVAKIVEGQLEKWFREICLLEQPWIREDKKSIGDLLKETIAKVGENCVIRRFARFELGEGAAPRDAANSDGDAAKGA